MKPLLFAPSVFNPLDFVAALFQANTFDEAFAVYTRCVQSLGFEGVLYTFIPQLHLQSGLPLAPLFITSDTYNPHFLKHYQEAGFEKHDFTIKKITQGETHVIDWWVEARKPETTAPERHVVITAEQDYGIKHGLSLPLVGAAGFGGASIISAEKDALYQRLLATNLSTLMCCTQIFHEHVMSKPALRAFFLAALLEQLSVKERQLLPFLITGLPMKTLPKYLPGISQKYGEKLLESILKKFGGINKAQLLYYLGLLQLLDQR